mmetsp:Transcript_118295/g.314800  ORF Transcript_118295/g.314800 Transcript_118295/m.314800 type:complete len:489 (-) Transcript_118295:580-2046(-)
MSPGGGGAPRQQPCLCYSARSLRDGQASSAFGLSKSSSPKISKALDGLRPRTTTSASLLVGAAENHVRLGVRVLDVPQGSQRGQGLDGVHGLELHLVLQAQEAPLHVLPARHLAVELPRDRPERLLGRLHAAEVVSVLELDISVHCGHFQRPVVGLPELVRVLIVADLRARPQVREAAGAGQVQAVLIERRHFLLGLRDVWHVLDLVASGSGAPLLGLAGGDALALRDLLLVQGRSAEALVLHRLQLLQWRLHDVAELRRRGHRDRLGVLALEAEDLLFLLFFLLGVSQALDALRDSRQCSLALLHGAGVGTPDQAPLLRELLVKLGILLVGASVLGPRGCGGEGGVADLVLLVLGVGGLAPLRLLFGGLPELRRHLVGGIVVRLHFHFHFQGLLLAQCRQDRELLLGVRLVEDAHRGARDHEARGPRLQLVVLREDVLALLCGVVVHLLLQLLVVLRALCVGHAHVGELIGRLVVDLALLVEDRLVA